MIDMFSDPISFWVIVATGVVLMACFVAFVLIILDDENDY